MRPKDSFATFEDGLPANLAATFVHRQLFSLVKNPLVDLDPFEPRQPDCFFALRIARLALVVVEHLPKDFGLPPLLVVSGAPRNVF